MKVDADDGGAEPQAGVPEHGGATGHGAPAAHGAPGTRGEHSRPSHSNVQGRPSSRPGTGADTGWATDADDPALPPEAASALHEASALSSGSGQKGTPSAAGASGASAPQSSMPAAQGAVDKNTNHTSDRRLNRPAMPVSFINTSPTARGGQLVLQTSAGAAPERSVTLRCDPPGGTHPKAMAACADVARAGGDLGQMPAGKNARACFMIYAPVRVSAQGQWHGQPVHFSEKYPNTCVMHDKTGSVFDF